MRQRHLRRNSEGFTLVELVVVVAISALMIGLSYSGFTSLQKKERVRAAANLLMGHLQEARMLAMEKRQSHRVIFNGTQYTICPFSTGDIFDTPRDPRIEQVDLSNDYPDVKIEGTQNFCFDMRGLPRTGTGAFLSEDAATESAINITLKTDDVRSCAVSMSMLGRLNVTCQDL